MSTDLFADFATNTQAEEDGVWVPYGDGELLIARSPNNKFNQLVTTLYSKNRRQIEAKTEAAKEKAEELMVEAMAKTILLGWKGEYTFQGAPLGEYSVEKAKKLLAIKDFRKMVDEIAADQGRYKAVQDEADAGN